MIIVKINKSMIVTFIMSPQHYTITFTMLCVAVPGLCGGVIITCTMSPQHYFITFTMLCVAVPGLCGGVIITCTMSPHHYNITFTVSCVAVSGLCGGVIITCTMSPQHYFITFPMSCVAVPGLCGGVWVARHAGLRGGCQDTQSCKYSLPPALVGPHNVYPRLNAHRGVTFCKRICKKLHIILSISAWKKIILGPKGGGAL